MANSQVRAEASPRKRARAGMARRYGQLLIAKVVLVGVAAALGGINRYRVVPVLDASGQGPVPEPVTRVLRRTLAAEALVLLTVVGATAVLVDVTPARAAVAAPYSEEAPLGEGRAELTIDPTRAGQAEGHLFLYDAEGDLLEAEEVTVRLSLPSADVAPIARTPLVAGPGHWVVDGSDMTIAGTWTVDVAARTSRFEELTSSFEVRIVP